MSSNPLRLLRTVASAFFGVRRKTDSDQDLQHLSLKQIIFAAVIVMALFVTTILLVVKTVLS
jgi:HD-like signal output (HDOD) protein